MTTSTSNETAADRIFRTEDANAGNAVPRKTNMFRFLGLVFVVAISIVFVLSVTGTISLWWITLPIAGVIGGFSLNVIPAESQGR